MSNTVITAEEVVRQGMKEHLKDYIPKLNAKIQLAENTGVHFISLSERIPDEVQTAYEQAGYEVGRDYNNTRISWQGKYDELSGDVDEVSKIIEEMPERPGYHGNFFDS